MGYGKLKLAHKNDQRVTRLSLHTVFQFDLDHKAERSCQQRFAKTVGNPF